MEYIEQFLSTFNEYYPFERYIMKEPKTIGAKYDDLYLTELFVKSTQMDEAYAGTGEFYLDPDEIFLKLKTRFGEEFNMAFYDLSIGLQETVVDLVVDDFGDSEYESLYCEGGDDDALLEEALLKQRELINSKYGECEIKNNFIIESTLNLLK